MELTTETWLLLLLSILLLKEYRGYRAAANARAISLHVLGMVIPALEARGYRTNRKQVSFGRCPTVSYYMESEHGLSITVHVDSATGYFHVRNMPTLADEWSELSHRFEVSGPWDELTVRTIDGLENDFFEWVGRGCRRWDSQAEPADHLSYFSPMHTAYIVEGADHCQAPTDIGYRLARWMDRAQPHQRYPLIPRLPRK